MNFVFSFRNDHTARFWQLFMTFHSSRKRHLKLIQQLQQFMRYKELPHSLQRRLLIYYNYRNKRGFERDKIIINHVSPYLREVRHIFSQKNFFLMNTKIVLCDYAIILASVNDYKTKWKSFCESLFSFVVAF